MNEFNVKVKLKEFTDDEQFQEALDVLRDAVIGERLKDILDSTEVEESVIDEILKHFHCRYSEKNVPAQMNTFEKQLEYRLRPFGILYRSVQLDDGWYHNATQLFLGTLKENGQTVLLKPARFGGYILLDPNTNQKRKINKKVASTLDEEALCFYPPLPAKSLAIKDLLHFMFGQLTIMDDLFYVGVMLILSMLGLLTPIFTKLLFGSILEYGHVKQLLALGSFMISYVICSTCLETFQKLIQNKVTTKQDVIVQAALMNRLIHLPSSFFSKYSSGELYYKIESVQTICSTLFDTIGTVGLTSLFSIIYVGQIFNFAPSLAIPSILFIIFSFLFSFLSAWLDTKHLEEELEATSKTSGCTYASVKGIQKIKLAGAEKRIFSRWAKIYAREASLEYNHSNLSKLSSVIQLTITLMGTLILYAIAIQKGISVDNYYAFSSAYGMIASAFTSLANACSVFALIRPMFELTKPILKEVPEYGENKEIISELTGSIEMNHVSFSYEEGMKNVIDDLSLSIQSGEYVAITGSTGCGKSTLLRLLLGFETPNTGTIFYDRHDMQDIDLTSLRKQIGTVQQNSRLFPSDVLSNITISNPLMSEEDAWQAAELAQIADDIRQMPMGMHTLISEGQGGVSGGQKQRLLIARALAIKPKVLFFDEATSALDNITQKKISDAIDQLNCTRVVIAHRLSTIKNADRILYLDEGKIAEQGTYDELIQMDGKFASLVERQRLEKA